MRRIFHVFLMLAVATVALIGCKQSDTGDSNTPQRTTTSITAEEVKLRPVSTDSLMQVIQTSDAKVTVVNVWATWCQPCREEFPDMLKAYRDLKDQGVRLLLVSADFPDQKSQAKQFLADHQVNFQTYFKTGKDMPFIEALNPEWTGALPGTFIYGPDGTLQQFWQGKASYEEFMKAIQDVLQS